MIGWAPLRPDNVVKTQTAEPNNEERKKFGPVSRLPDERSEISPGLASCDQQGNRRKQRRLSEAEEFGGAEEARGER